ncbi:MAG: aspartate/glutamate racemase family protein [Actinobacteria bacterium]|nr:aspartate/glutamate racemase family protein [Actinomycetota bacterium]
MRHLGLMVPSSNTSTELDFAAWAPTDVGLHAARMWMVDATLEAATSFVEEEAPRAARQLGTLEPDAVVFACTAAGASLGPEGEAELERSLAEAAGVPVISTNAAVAAEIAARSPRRLAVLTPYTPDITEEVVGGRRREGYEVVSAAGMGIEMNREIGRVEASRLLDFARAELAGLDFDLLFVSCTNLRTAAAIEPLRELTGRPVVTSNGATMKAALVALGLAGDFSEPLPPARPQR